MRSTKFDSRRGTTSALRQAQTQVQSLIAQAQNANARADELRKRADARAKELQGPDSLS
jgi:hypothetical protein